MKRTRQLRVERVVDYEVVGQSVVFRCQIGGLDMMFMEVQVFGRQTFRVRLVRDSSLRPRQSDIVLAEPLSIFAVNESEKYVDIEASGATMRVFLNPWHIEVFNDKGETIFQTLEDDLMLTGHRYSPGTGVEVEPEDLDTMWDVRWDVKKTFSTFLITHDERMWGFGEKFTNFDKRGQKMEMWNIDTLGARSEWSYKNIPFFMSSAGYGLYVDSTDRVKFDVGVESNRSLTVELPGDQIDFYVIGGDTPKDILRAYCNLTGKPSLPPKWSFGLWISNGFERVDAKTVEEQAKTIRELDIPCDVYHFDCKWLKDDHWSDLTWDESRFPEPKKMLSKFKEQGFKICVWENSYVSIFSEMFKEGAEKGYFLHNPDGSVYKANLWLEWQPIMGVVDFTNPDAVEWYKQRHRTLLDMGVDTFKTDFGEDLPPDAVYHNGKNGQEMHNLYPLGYQKTVFDAVKEKHGKGIIWARAACAGSQRFPTHWSGDPYCNFEDMASVLRAGLSNSLSGLAFWSHDIGGFKGIPSPELYIRWAQFGMFSSHARCHSQTSRFPWDFDDNIVDIFRMYTKLRYSMLPYLYSYAQEACESGLPVVRPMLLEYPEDRNCLPLDAQYMFGEELLVAPILNAEGNAEFYLPEGTWTHLLTNERLEGGRWIQRQYSLEQMPLYVKENSMIPMAISTAYIGEKEITEYDIHIFGDSQGNFDTQFRLFDDEVPGRAEKDWENNLTITQSEKGILFQAEQEETWTLCFHHHDSPSHVIAKNELQEISGDGQKDGASNEGWWTSDGNLYVRFSGDRCLIA